jgi:hypothetical protein
MISKNHGDVYKIFNETFFFWYYPVLIVAQWAKELIVFQSKCETFRRGKNHDRRGREKK